MTKYVIDTSSLNELQDKYPKDVSYFKPIHDNVYEMFENGDLFSVREVYEELKDSGILYDEKKSLYDNSLKVIEAKQKHVMEDIVKRFDSIIEKIHVSNDDAKRREIIKILIKEMNNRKYIFLL